MNFQNTFFKRMHIKLFRYFATNNKCKEMYFIRHGQTDWNKLGKTQGQKYDILLNDTGIQQSIFTGKYLQTFRLNGKSFDCIISSPASRCKETSFLIANELNINKTKIIYNDDIKEIDKGNLAGLTNKDNLKQIFNNHLHSETSKLIDPIEKYKIQHPITNKYFLKNTIKKYDIQITGVEHPINLHKRVINFIETIKKSDHNKIIIISHNGFLETLLKTMFNINVLPKGNLKNGENCTICYCTYENNNFIMQSPQNTEHLNYLNE